MIERRLSDAVSVASQLEPADLPGLAARGFRVLIDNRPDDEVGPAEDSAAMERAAQAAGMAFRYVPFRPGVVTEETIAAFADALELGGPALAYCRSGTRSTMLWALAEAPHQGLETVLRAATAAGYDLSGIAPMLKARAAGQPLRA